LLLIAMYALYGFFVVSRYDSINEFILPSALWVIWFSIPLVYYFDLWRHWLIYLHPLQAPLILMQSAFDPQPAWKILYGILYSLAWIGLGYFFSQQAFYRFVIRKEGTGK
jgi:fluoroquinolone transport system permease protein